MKKYGRFFLIAAFGTMLVMLVVWPDIYIDAVTEGLDIYVKSVLPGLFPFLVLTGIITALGVGNILSKAFEKPVNKLFGAPPIGGYIFAVSMLSGYPVGAKTIYDFYKNGIIDEEEAKAISAFASTSGPLFVLGTVGVKMLQNYKVGVIILAAHFASAIINGVIFKGLNGNVLKPTCLPKTGDLNGKVFNEIIENSVAAVMRVGACMAFFNMIIVALTNSGLVGMIGGFFEYIGFSEKGLGIGFASGLIEVTKGVYLIAESGAASASIVPIISLLVSFGGASVALQSMCFLSDAGINVRYYLSTKISQGILAYAIASVAAALLL